jgi:pyruvate kinase
MQGDATRGGLDPSEIRALHDELARLRRELLEAEARHGALLSARSPDAQRSLRNFLHYCALRRHEVRPVQERLARLGLSSLGRSEAHVLASLDAVLRVLAALAGSGTGLSREGPSSEGAVGFDDGERLLEAHAERVLGPRPTGRRTRIMVTLPGEAALDAGLVRSLVARGMNLVRINCAHDDAPAWARMVENVRAAARDAGRPCLVAMDLAGPKLRTGLVGEAIALRVGDPLMLLRAQEVGRGQGIDAASGTRTPARVSCTLPRALDFVEVGESVWIDDGKIGGVVEDVADDGVLVRVHHARKKGSELGADRGINLPDSALALPAVTEKDREDLAFVARHADLVGLSFVQRPSDVEDVERCLAELAIPRETPLGMILKIETRRAFAELPALLLATLGTRPVSVMIARGDLAVEVGYERLAEVQEEMLWLAEAAHVPVIWATQVLERLAKKGRPSRAEITDAAMGERAECVMLNKGPHIEEAVAMLDGILRRMEGHQHKKRAMMRPLSVSRGLA